jgi:hypothetical protein
MFSNNGGNLDYTGFLHFEVLPIGNNKILLS